MDKIFLQEKEQEFVANGYVIFKNLYSLPQVSRMYNIALDLIEIAKSITYPHDNIEHRINHNGSEFSLKYYQNQTIIHRISWALGSKTELAEFSRAPELLTIIAKLLQATTADHLINVIHPKLPHDNMSWIIHQDIANRMIFDPEWKNLNQDRSYVVCITAIDAMNEGNGGLYIVPGSHKTEKKLSLAELLKLDLQQSFVPNLEPGDTMCMNQYLAHYSFPNDSSSSRIILLDGFAVVGANSKPYPGDKSACKVELLGEALLDGPL